MTHPLIEIAREAGFETWESKNRSEFVIFDPYGETAITAEITALYALVEAKVRRECIGEIQKQYASYVETDEEEWSFNECKRVSIDAIERLPNAS